MLFPHDDLEGSWHGTQTARSDPISGLSTFFPGPLAGFPYRAYQRALAVRKAWHGAVSPARPLGFTFEALQ